MSQPDSIVEELHELEADRPDTAWRLADLEPIAKGTAAIGVLCYAVGFITTNIYLLRLGISDFSILKPKSILTGFIIVALLIVLSTLPIVLVKLLKKGKTSWSRREWVLLALVLIGIFACPVLIGVGCRSRLDALPPFMPVEHDWSSLTYASLRLTLPCYLIGFVATASTRIRRNYLVAIVFVACCALVVFMWAFARDVYPIMPAQFGGGYNGFAILVCSKDGADVARALTLDIGEGERTIRSVQLLHETDKFIVFRQYEVNFQRATKSDPYATKPWYTIEGIVQMDRNLVQGIIPEEVVWSGGLSRLAPAGPVGPSDLH